MSECTSINDVCGTDSKAAVFREKFLQTSTKPFTALDTLIGTLFAARTRHWTLGVDHP